MTPIVAVQRFCDLFKKIKKKNLEKIIQETIFFSYKIFDFEGFFIKKNIFKEKNLR